MKRVFFLILSAILALTSCSTARRVSSDPVQPWVGCTTEEIIKAMGDPSRIDSDGKGGSVIVYESEPGYDDPNYDILDPEASKRPRQYARFYLDSEGICYHVDTNRPLPAAPSATSPVRVSFGAWFDWLFMGLLLVGLLL
ncbi:MAG: hypothetical protein IJG35_10745 [Bacteroidales bacterium]|nr:hypothetical protein [Bacteroidales bacterium]